MREHDVWIPDADRDEPFVYRGAAGFLLWVAALSLEQSLSFGAQSSWSREFGVSVSLALALVGAIGMAAPHWLGRVVRRHPASLAAAAAIAVPLIVLPGGRLEPARPAVLILTALACAGQPRRAALSLAGCVVGVDLALVMLRHSIPELRAAHVLGYELVVIPAGILSAGLLGSIVGEASLVSRSLGETLRRETTRRHRLEQHVRALRDAVDALVDALPHVVAHAGALAEADRTSVVAAVDRTRRRAGDVTRSSVTVGASAPRTISEDLTWLAACQRATDPSQRIELRIAQAVRALDVAAGARASMRVAVGRALDNACDHAATGSLVLISATVDTSALRIQVRNHAPGARAIDWGRGLRGSRRELLRFGGDLRVVLDKETATAVWTASLPRAAADFDPAQRAGSLHPADGASAAGRVRELLAGVLIAWRRVAVAMVLGTTFLDPEILTAHRRTSQAAIVVTLGATEMIAALARRGGWERRSAIIRGVIAVGACAFVTHGERTPLAGWACLVTCEVLWHVGWRAYAASLVGVVGALVFSLSVPPDQDATRALWSESLFPLWAAPIASAVVFYVARTVERERAVGIAAHAARTLTELSIRCANAHALVQLLRLTVGSRFPGNHAVRQDVFDRAERIVDLCAAAPGGASSRDALLRELGEVVAHRVSPARCVIRDHTALPLEAAALAPASASGATSHASLLSLFSAAAEEVARRSPTDRLGRPRLETVFVALRDRVDSGTIELALTTAPNPRPESPGEFLLAEVARAGGHCAQPNGDGTLIITLPATALSA